jgi:hypothetical protein
MSYALFRLHLQHDSGGESVQPAPEQVHGGVCRDYGQPEPSLPRADGQGGAREPAVWPNLRELMSTRSDVEEKLP